MTTDIERAATQLQYLQDLVDGVRQRASVLCPHFVIWGVVWMVGYVATSQLGPSGDDGVWAVSLICGGVASMLVGMAHRRNRPQTVLERRLMSVNAVLIAFAVFGPVVFLHPTADADLALAWFPVLFGVIYFIDGLFLGRTLRWAGAWLVSAGLASLALPLEMQGLWLAAAGGGCLIVTGWILWRQGRAADPVSRTISPATG